MGLVGVISADVTLNIPDFRSAENLSAGDQAAGRAGRGDRPGKVIIQSYTPEHYAIAAASHHDIQAFYQQELFLRKRISYPPFADFIQMVVSAETAKSGGSAKTTAAALKPGGTSGDGYIMGPQPAVIIKRLACTVFRFSSKRRPEREKNMRVSSRK